MHHRNLLTVAFVLVAATAPVAAQETTTIDLESATALATANSATIVALEREVDAAADALGVGPYRDDVSLSLSGSLGGDRLSALTAGGSAAIDASVDLLPHLTLTGRLAGSLSTADPGPTDPVTGSVGLTLEPLADAGGDERDRIVYERAVLALESGARSVAYTAVTRLLDAVAARDDLALARAKAALAERRLASVQALAERDRATDDDVEAARDALRSARQARERKALAADRAAWSLADAVGLPRETISLPDWDRLGLASAAADVRARAGGRASRPQPDALAEEAPAVRTAALDAQAARVELAAARRFTPDLSAGAQARFPLEPEGPQQQPRYSLSLDVTVRPSDWDGTARIEAEEDLAFAERALQRARTVARYDARSALLELDIAIEELDAELADLELAGRDLREAAFRFERGDVTRLALDEAELDVAGAEAAVDAARAAVVKRWYAIDLGQF